MADPESPIRLHLLCSHMLYTFRFFFSSTSYYALSLSGTANMQDNKSECVTGEAAGGGVV